MKKGVGFVITGINTKSGGQSMFRKLPEENRVRKTRM